MRRIHWLWWMAVGGTLLVVAATAWSLPDLPERVPTHWNIRGQIDAYGPKSSLWILPATMGVMIAMFAVMPLISPKPFDLDTNRGVLRQMMIIIVAMIAYIHWVTLSAASGIKLPIDRTLVAGICLFLSLIGNLMGKIKRNLYMGIRTPWTIANDRVWADTHRLGARLFVGAGLLGVAICVVLPPIFAIMPILLAGVFLVLYSYILYQRLERRGEIPS